MAVTISTLNVPTTITLGTAGNATKITPPPFTRLLWIQFRTATGSLAYSGTDGAAIASDYLSFTVDQLVEIQHQGDFPFYVASGSTGSKVVITARNE